MKSKILCLCSVIAFSLALLSCDNGTEPDDNMPDNGKNIQVIYPKGGESFTVEDTVTISVKIDAGKVASIVPAISKNNGMNFDNIPAESIKGKDGGGGQLLTCQWIIGKETIPVIYDAISTTCKIKVYDYDVQTENDQSATFTISPKNIYR